MAKGDTIHLVVIVPSLLSIHTLLRLPGISLQIGAYMSASWRIPVVWLLNKREWGLGLLIIVENLEDASKAKSKGGTTLKPKHLPTLTHQCRPQSSCPHSSVQSGFYSAH